MDLLLWLQQLRTPVGNAFFLFITQFGDQLVLGAAVLVIYWCVSRQAGYRLGVTVLSANLVGQSLKVICRVPRPWVLDPRVQPVPEAVGSATGYSFPSGHTGSATSFFGTLCLWARRRWISILCAAMVALVMLSRLYLGVHTPQDVLVSLAVAGLITLAVARVFPHLQGRPHRLFILSIAAGVVSAGMLILAALWVAAGWESGMMADCVKSAGALTGLVWGWYLQEKHIRFDVRARLPVQVLKVLIGLATLGLVMAGLKALAGDSLLLALPRYLLIVLYASAGYPALMKLALGQGRGRR